VKATEEVVDETPPAEDETTSEEVCPALCTTCKPGGRSDGGLALTDGVCTHWCSKKGHCGASKWYKAGHGGTDCTGCSPAPEGGATEDAEPEDETSSGDAATISKEKIVAENRCGPKFHDHVCDCHGDYPSALYCNEHNGWCGNRAEHKNAQESTKYDCTIAKKTYKIVVKLPLALQSMTPKAQKQLSVGVENAFPCGQEGMTCFTHARAKHGVSLIQGVAIHAIIIVITVSGPRDKIDALPDTDSVTDLASLIAALFNSLKAAATDPDLSAAMASASVNKVKSVDGPAWIEGKNAENGGISCLTINGDYAEHVYSHHFGGHGDIWYGELAEAKSRCDANAECDVLHDWDGDGKAWRACRSVTYNDDGPAHTMVRAI
jgi:hypothetical protein